MEGEDTSLEVQADQSNSASKQIKDATHEGNESLNSSVESTSNSANNSKRKREDEESSGAEKNYKTSDKDVVHEGNESLNSSVESTSNSADNSKRKREDGESSDAKKKHKTGDHDVPLSQIVAEHYNSREHQHTVDREKSPIFHLKNFNNWIKSNLINDYLTVKRGKVLDLCCGKGGDFLKWSTANVDLVVGVDIARVSLEHARNRYNDNKTKRYTLKLYEADVGKANISDYLDDGLLFDLCSCQFSLHYCFGTRERAETIVKNAADRLKVGGFFIGTIPNAPYLVRRARAEGGKFQNSIYSVDFGDEYSNLGAFGSRYTFKLADAVEEIPEYLVHPKVLISLAEKYGMELVKDSYLPFHVHYEINVKNPANRERLKRMKCLDSKGTVSKEEWEALGLYSTFAFQKKTQTYFNDKKYNTPDPKPIQPNDMQKLN